MLAQDTSRRLVLLAALLPFAAPHAPASADDRMPGEAIELTEEVRATAQKEVDALCAAPDEEGAKKPRRALLILGPAVWPVIENRMKLLPPAQARPHLNYLRALLSKKEEPEFDWVRGRIRRVIIVGRLEDMRQVMADFRVGRPDPKKPGQKIAPTVRPTVVVGGTLYRSGDGSIVLCYGADGTDKAPDSVDIDLTEPDAGFVAALSGKPKPAPRHSGKGGVVNVTAPMGFAFAWASDGAEGMRPGGEGGEGGSPKAVGGAGTFERTGNGGAGAPGG
jgi:hypothetical protein